MTVPEMYGNRSITYFSGAAEGDVPPTYEWSAALNICPAVLRAIAKS
jgi:hypothetical protein